MKLVNKYYVPGWSLPVHATEEDPARGRALLSTEVTVPNTRETKEADLTSVEFDSKTDTVTLNWRIIV